MSPIHLSRAERASLRKLVKLDGTCERRLLRQAHAEQFLREGLLMQTPQRYHLTVRGQVEILRQRFHGMRGSVRGVTVDELNSVLDQRKFG